MVARLPFWEAVPLFSNNAMKKLLSILLLCLLLAVGCEQGLPLPPKPDKEQNKEQDEDKGDNGQQQEPQQSIVVNGTTIAQTTTLYGIVKDKQSNQGIAGVVVSDGFTCVKTDDNGVYQLTHDSRSKMVYISVPAQYEIPVDGGNMPAFYKQFTIAEGEKFRYDFALEPLPGGKQDRFTLLTLADIQVNDTQDSERFRTETIPDIDNLAQSLVNPYAVTLGDITHRNNSAMYTKVRQAMMNREVIFMQCMGNHDHLNELDQSQKNTYWESLKNFHRYFGPQNYSFDRSDTHIVVMDNALQGQTRPDDDALYTAGFFDWQFEWLKQDLSFVPKDKMIILCMHIPFRKGSGSDHSDARYRQKTLELLSEYHEAHLMIGHTHRHRNWIHTVNGKTIYEHIHGAVCGGMWHSTTNVDGAPNGYGVYEISGNTLDNWYYKGTGCSVDMQIRAYDGGQKYYDPRYSQNQPSKRGTFSEYTWNLDGYIIANIWNIEHGNWDITLWQNGEQVCQMEKINDRDWWVAYWYMEVYCTLDDGYRGDTVHLYKGRLADKNAPFTIKAVDRSGKRAPMSCSTLTTDYSEVWGDFVTVEESVPSFLTLPESAW